MRQRRRRRNKLPQEIVTTTIESLSHDGRGVTHINDKAIFIDGALPNEKITFKYTAVHRKYDEGKVEKVLTPSADRVEPLCPHFMICGGCNLQHLNSVAQIHYKQTALLDNLQYISKITVQSEQVLPPIMGDTWGYRRKARLGVKFVQKKGRVLVGFREKRHHFLADIQQCNILHPSIGEKIPQLQELIGQLDAKKRIPQIEVAVGDNNTALVFRHLDPLSIKDLEKLQQFSNAFEFIVYLQSAGADSVQLLYPHLGQSSSLYYEHPDFKSRIDLGPLDFFQVNRSINQQMVRLAIDALQLKKTDEVLDLFCGLGNFTLPIAYFARHVVGIEFDPTMVRRAKETARKNNVNNTTYHVGNLMSDIQCEPWFDQKFDKILLDPPRSGAKEVIAQIKKFQADIIVYVSCHPATLARDAFELTQHQGYQLSKIGVMDMFPHTAHVESIAIFIRDKN